MMDEDAALDSLTSEENHDVWNETERKFWDQFSEDQSLWRASHEQKAGRATTELRVELTSLTAQRNALAETQARLARELANVEDELRAIGLRCERKATELDAVDEEHRAAMGAQVANWEHQARTMTNFFRKKRGESPLPDHVMVTNGVPPPPSDTRPSPASGPIPPPRPSSAPRAPAQPIARLERTTNGSHPTHYGDKLVDVVDADDNVIGPVQRVDPWNQWVGAVLKLPVKRPVKIRRGRRFNEDHLATIYERAEAKGVKWLSCMIQAIGEVQSQRCQSCDKNQGAFEQCIIVGGDLLQKCGNCEWNRQGCHGASGETIDIVAAERQVRERQARVEDDDDHEPREVREPEVVESRLAVHDREDRPRDQSEPETQQLPLRQSDDALERERRHREALDRERRQQEALTREAMAREVLMANSHAPNPRPQAAQWSSVRPPSGPPYPPLDHNARRSHGLADRDILMGNPATPPPASVLPAPTSVPTPPPIGHIRGPLPPIRDPRDRLPLPGSVSSLPAPMTSGFTPANRRSTPPSRRSMTPMTAPLSAESSPQALSRPFEEEKQDAPLVEINKENLALRHDGEVYTAPECMVGVPVAKIHAGHPYWDPDWKDVRAEILEARERWREKHQITIEAEARNEKTGSSKYQIGRQVNRGTKILEFLDDENQISPYQLLAKRYMHSAKGGITSYDTLFRLCETLSELSKFNLDIAPMDWMRHRLHEILVEKGGYGAKSFNLPKIVHDFYHDPKLTALRHKHGFKNIGRPSGQPRGTPASGGRTSLGSINGSTPQPKKRKSAASLSATPKEYTYVESPLANQMVLHDEGPYLHAKSQAANKRPKYENETPRRPVLYFRDLVILSDRTLSEMGPIHEEHVFQLKQVQTRAETSSWSNLQFWTWIPEKRILEHRVFEARGSGPAECPPYGAHSEFGLRLDDVAEMQYDFESNRAYIYIPVGRDSSPLVRQRRGGDMMVEPRDSVTLQRLLRLCEALRIPLKDLPSGTLRRWEDFRTEQPAPLHERERLPVTLTH